MWPLCVASHDFFHSRIRPKASADLRRRLALQQNDVGSEVVPALEERRAHSVAIYGDSGPLEVADLLRGESTGDEDFDFAVAGLIEGATNIPHELWIHTSGPKLSHLLPQRPVDQHFTGIEPYSVQPLTQ